MRAALWIPGLLALVTGLALGAPADAGLPPKPAQYVEDPSGLLGASTRVALNQKLDAYERETSNQVLVAIFPSVPEDYAMEDFTQRTAEAWGVGQKATDNGAVLFIFPKDRKLRIEVGYGLEGAIPDATAKSILEREITPAFRAGDFDGGVTRGVDAILAAARGEYQGTGRTNADAPAQGSPESSGEGLVAFIVIGAIVVIVLSARFGGGGSGWSYDAKGRRRRRTSSWTSGSWGGGGFGGGGFGGGSSGGGGGGFSGGGGSFGGGGASGGW